MATHVHNASSDWKQANKEHFDSKGVSSFDIPWVKAMQRDLTTFLLADLPYIGIPTMAKAEDGSGVRLLDYACGNGMMSLALAPYASQLCGMDIAPAMVQEYNATAKREGLDSRMHAVEADITEGAAPSLQDFDVALVCMALHHMQHPDAVLKALLGRLRPGGKVVIVDWEAGTRGVAGKDPHSHVEEQEMDDNSKELLTSYKKNLKGHAMHDGFHEAQLLGLFVGAGLVEGQMRRLPDRTQMPEEMGGSVQAFVAVAKKPE